MTFQHFQASFKTFQNNLIKKKDFLKYADMLPFDSSEQLQMSFALFKKLDRQEKRIFLINLDEVDRQDEKIECRKMDKEYITGFYIPQI